MTSGLVRVPLYDVRTDQSSAQVRVPLYDVRPGQGSTA